MIGIKRSQEQLIEPTMTIESSENDDKQREPGTHFVV